MSVMSLPRLHEISQVPSPSNQLTASPFRNGMGTACLWCSLPLRRVGGHWFIGCPMPGLSGSQWAY